MKLAQMFEQIVGDGSGVRFVAYDGSEAGPRDAEATIDLQVADRAALHRDRSRRPRARPGFRDRSTSTSRATCTSALQSLLGGSGRRSAERPGRAAARPRHRRPAPAAPSRRGGAAAAPPRPPALQGARRRSDPAPLRRLEPLLLLHPRPVDGLHLRRLPRARLDARGGAGGEVRPRLPQARPQAGHAPARRRLRLGRHGHARRRALRRARARRHAVAASRPSGAPRRSSTRGLHRPSPRSGYLDYRDVREGGFDAVSSIGLTEHIGMANLPSYFSFLAGRLRAGRAAAEPLHHPAERPDGSRTGGFIDRYIFPDGELEGIGTLIVGDEQPRVRGAARGEPARALRDDPARLGRQPGRQLGRRGGRGRASAGRGSGGSTSPRPRVGFEKNHIQLHQVLGVKLGAERRAGWRCAPTGDVAPFVS